MTEKSSAPEGEMPTLAPCPFCGGAPKFLALTESDGFEREYLVHCDECAISLGGEYQSEAIAAWNRREYAATSAAQAASGGAVSLIDGTPQQPVGRFIFRDGHWQQVYLSNPEGQLLYSCPVLAAPDHPSPSREGPSDAEMLDWLDSNNRALNEHYGTTYGWAVVLSPNVTRVMTERRPADSGHVADIDVHDSRARGHNSIRAALAAAMKEHQP